MIQYHNRQWFFNLVVHISGIIDKTNDAYTEIEDTFDKEEVEMENKTIPSEEMKRNRGVDTIDYRMTTIPNVKFKDQWFPYTGQVKVVRGYSNARKDSIYHANLSNDSFYYHITIEQLHNEE